MTFWFDLAFTGCFYLHCVNFLFFTFLDPTTSRRYRPKNNKSSQYGFYLISCFIVEILIRCAIYFASVLQLVLLMTGSIAYCTQEVKTL